MLTAPSAAGPGVHQHPGVPLSAAHTSIHSPSLNPLPLDPLRAISFLQAPGTVQHSASFLPFWPLLLCLLLRRTSFIQLLNTDEPQGLVQDALLLSVHSISLGDLTCPQSCNYHLPG